MCEAIKRISSRAKPPASGGSPVSNSDGSVKSTSGSLRAICTRYSSGRARRHVYRFSSSLSDCADYFLLGDTFGLIIERAERAGFASLWLGDHFFQIPFADHQSTRYWKGGPRWHTLPGARIVSGWEPW
jgi:hypothetical protein